VCWEEKPKVLSPKRGEGRTERKISHFLKKEEMMAKKCCCKYSDEAGRAQWIVVDARYGRCDSSLCPQPPQDHPKWKFIGVEEKKNGCTDTKGKESKGLIQPNESLEEIISAVKRAGEWEGDFTIGSGNLVEWTAEFTGPDGMEVIWPDMLEPIQ